MMQDYGKRREAQPSNQARENELRLNHLQSADLRVCAFVLLAVAIQADNRTLVWTHCIHIRSLSCVKSY